MYIGIDIGGTKCAVVSSADGQTVREKIRFATEDKENTLKRILEAVTALGPPQAIGVSCGGPLDEKGGIILSPPNLPDWDRVEIVKMLKERFSVPVRLRNDANACALAEWRFGAGQGCENMIFLTCGTGFGGGLILNGKLYAGATGNAGEIGHVRLADHGPAGYGKIGSAEGFCSGTGIREMGRTLALEALQRGESPPVSANQNHRNLRHGRPGQCGTKRRPHGQRGFCPLRNHAGKGPCPSVRSSRPPKNHSRQCLRPLSGSVGRTRIERNEKRSPGRHAELYRHRSPSGRENR